MSKFIDEFNFLYANILFSNLLHLKKESLVLRAQIINTNKLNF